MSHHHTCGCAACMAFVGPPIQGDRGLQGERGLHGDRGDKGYRGDKGDKGDTGEEELNAILVNVDHLVITLQFLVLEAMKVIEAMMVIRGILEIKVIKVIIYHEINGRSHQW
jgi:hypothetical protein